MQKRALISGITGQDGSYLADHLLEKGYEVHGLIMDGDAGVNIAHCRDRLTLHSFSLSEFVAWTILFRENQFDEFYHLAAQSHVGQSFDGEVSTLDTNVRSLYVILSALKQESRHTKMFFAASSEIFQKEAGHLYQEDSSVQPSNPYGISKAVGKDLCRYYRDAFGLHISCGVLFNHESPRRGPQFVTQKVCLALNAIKAGEQEILELGNIDAQRDWGYAPEYTDAMWLMLQQDVPDDFILATGILHSLREWIEACARYLEYDLEWKGKGLEEAGVDRKSGKTLVKVNPEFYRPGPDVGMRGDNTKAGKVLGWHPQTDFETLISFMMGAAARE